MVVLVTITARTVGCSLLLGALGCQPTTEGSSASELSTRLEATEQRLASIETKLDAIDAKLDASSTRFEPLMEWAELAKTKEQERATRRKELDDRREERALRREQVRGGLESSDPEAAPSDRAIDGAAEGIQCTGLGTETIECRVDRALIDHILANPAVLAKQARIVPSMRDGKTLGYKFYGIRPGSLPKLLGMKNGDLLEAVDGESLDSLDRAMELFIELRGAKKLELALVRKGAPLTMKIVIEE